MHKLAGAQVGMVLLLCMIFLTAMMLLGLSASADTILQNQLAANLQTAERVKQTALAGLERGEKWLIDAGKPVDAICPPPCKPIIIYPAGTLPADVQHKPLAWWLTHGQTVGNNLPPSKNKTNPSVWLIESLYTIVVAERPDERRSWYRVLARASDPSGKVVSIVESIVLKTWSNKENPPLTIADDPALCESGKCGRLAWRRRR